MFGYAWNEETGYCEMKYEEGYGDYKDLHYPEYKIDKLTTMDYDNEMPDDYGKEHSDIEALYKPVAI